MKSSAIGFGFIVTTTSLAFVVSQLDVSIVNIALPAIGKSFKTGVSSLQWIVDAYTIAFAALMLSAGGLSDLLGAKRLFQLGLLVFALASAGCGMAWSSVALIGFRAIQGIGSAIMLPSSLSILNQAFSHDPGRRARAVSLWTAGGGVAIAAGPVLGGLLLHISNWRMIFFVNIPICLVGLLCSVRLPDSGNNGNKGFDIPGQLTWMLSLTALIAAIIEWRHLGIHSPLIYGGLIISFVLLGIFLWREKKAAAPILPLDLFRSANFNILIGMGMILNGAYYGTVFVLSLYLQNVLHYSGLTAGLAFLPLTAGFIISNLASGALMKKYGIRLPILSGLIVFSIGYACLLIAGQNTPYWQLLLPFLALPLGMGLSVPAMTTGTLATVERNRSGIASAVLNTTRQAAGAIGVAAFGALAAGGSPAIVRAISITSIISGGCVLLYAVLVFKRLNNK